MITFCANSAFHISFSQLQLQITSTHFNNDYFEHMNHPMSGGLEWKVIAHIPLRLALGFKDLDNNNDLHIHDEHVSEQIL